MPKVAETLGRAASPGTSPREAVAGPRPWNCVNCTWHYRSGTYQLKYIHAGCPEHYDLPRVRADNLTV